MKPTLLLPAVAIGLALGCGESFKPSNDNVVGNYTAQSFTTTDSAGTTDQLAAGATLTMNLAAGGAVTGHLFIPTLIDADLAGTWALQGDLITFTQTADTFVRDMTWVAGENRLSGDETFGNVRVRVVLTK
jgi:hypothetical protein